MRDDRPAHGAVRADGAAGVAGVGRLDPHQRREPAQGEVHSAAEAAADGRGRNGLECLHDRVSSTVYRGKASGVAGVPIPPRPADGPRRRHRRCPRRLGRRPRVMIQSIRGGALAQGLRPRDRERRAWPAVARSLRIVGHRNSGRPAGSRARPARGTSRSPRGVALADRRIVAPRNMGQQHVDRAVPRCEAPRARHCDSREPERRARGMRCQKLTGSRLSRPLPESRQCHFRSLGAKSHASPNRSPNSPGLVEVLPEAAVRGLRSRPRSPDRRGIAATRSTSRRPSSALAAVDVEGADAEAAGPSRAVSRSTGAMR